MALAFFLIAPTAAVAANLPIAPTASTPKKAVAEPAPAETAKHLLPLRVGAYAPLQRGCARIEGNYADYDSILNFYGDDFTSSSVGYRIETAPGQGPGYALRVHVEPTGGIGYAGKAKHILWNLTITDATHFAIKDHDRDGDRSGPYVWCAKDVNAMMDENFRPEPEAKTVAPSDQPATSQSARQSTPNTPAAKQASTVAEYAPAHVDDEIGDPYEHNGSTMWLYRRKGVIAYNFPKDSIRGTVKEGDVVFRGQFSRAGAQGTAYVFKKGCAPAPYPVTGRFSGPRNETLVLEGASPIRDKVSCAILGYTASSANAHLRFTPGGMMLE